MKGFLDRILRTPRSEGRELAVVMTILGVLFLFYAPVIGIAMIVLGWIPTNPRRREGARKVGNSGVRALGR